MNTCWQSTHTLVIIRNNFFIILFFIQTNITYNTHHIYIYISRMNKDEIYNKPIILFFPLQSLTVEENIQASLLLLTVPRCTPLPPQPSPYYPITLSNPFTAKNPGQACPSKTVLTQIRPQSDQGLHYLYFLFIN